MTDTQENRNFELLLARLVDQTASEQDIAALEEILSSSEESLTQYVRYLNLYTTLKEKHDETWLEELEEIAESDRDVASCKADEEPPQAIPNSVRISFMTNFDWRVHPFMFIACATAFTGIFWTLVIALIWQTVSGPNVAQNGFDKNAPIVATYCKNHDAEWDCDPPDVPMMGVPFYRGEVVKLKSGLVEIEFKSGAEVTLEGPCEFTLLGKNIGNLRSGKLVAYVRERAKGFAVVTPHARIVDLGTEFGVQVDKKGDTHAQVYQGLVEVRPSTGETQRLSAGEAVQVNLRGKVASVPFDNKRFDQEQFNTDLSPGQGISRITGAIRLLKAPPGTVAANKFEDSTNIMLFRERQGVRLSQDVKVTVASPGNGGIGQHVKGELSTGQRVDSYLLHLDPVGNQPANEVQIVGRITFDRPVLGIIATTPGLIQTDSMFGAKGTRYDTAGTRTLDDNQNDTIGLSADRHTVLVDWKAFGMDQVRVLVSARPDAQQ